MVKSLLRNTLLYTTIFFLVSCNLFQKSPKEEAFSQLISIKELNTKITLFNPPGLDNELIYGNSISLVVQNHSKDTVVFPMDGGIKIFVYQSKSNHWQEVPNGMEYSGASKSLTLTEKGINSELLVSFYPNLEGFLVPTDIRIISIGTVYKDNQPTKEQVAASMDLSIKKRDTCNRGVCIYLDLKEPILLNKTETLTVTIKSPLDNPFEVDLASDDISVLKEPEVIGPNGLSNRTSTGLKWWVSAKANIPLIITTPILFTKDEDINLSVRASHQVPNYGVFVVDALNIKVSGKNIKVTHLFPQPNNNN